MSRCVSRYDNEAGGIAACVDANDHRARIRNEARESLLGPGGSRQSGGPCRTLLRTPSRPQQPTANVVDQYNVYIHVSFLYSTFIIIIMI